MNVSSLSMVLGACICYESVKWQNGVSVKAMQVPKKCIAIMIMHHREVFK